MKSKLAALIEIETEIVKLKDEGYTQEIDRIATERGRVVALRSTQVRAAFEVLYDIIEAQAKRIDALERALYNH